MGNWQWFNDSPQLIQLAILLAIVLGGGGGLFVFVWSYLFGWARKVNGHTAQLAQIELERLQMQKDFDTKLEKGIAEARDNAIADAKEVAKVQREADLSEFTKQLEGVASAREKRENEHKAENEKNAAKLKEESQARQTAEKERDELRQTIQNLNDRIDDIKKETNTVIEGIQGQVTSQQAQIRELQRVIEEKNLKEKEQDKLIKAYKEELAVLNDEKQIWVAEKDLMFKVLETLGVKPSIPEEKQPEEKPTTETEFNAT